MATIVFFNPFTDELFPVSTTGFDARYVNITGDTMTGDLIIQPAANSITTLQVNQADGTNVLTVDTTNKAFQITGATSLVADVATTRPLIVQGAIAQSANLQEWQDSLNNVLGSVDASGNFYVADNLSFQFRDAQLYVNSDADGYLDLHADTATRLDNFYSRASYWWYCKYMDAISVSPGGSGATQIIPNANTLGGYQLDAATEYLYFNGEVCNNWDGASDLVVTVKWEVNVDNTGGNVADTVDLSLLCYYKGEGETATKTQTVEVPVTVGQSPRYKQFITTFTIDWDLPGNVVEVGDVFAFRLNLETDTSEVTNVIVNFAHFSYRTATKQPTV